MPADIIESLKNPWLLDVIDRDWQRNGRGVTATVSLNAQSSEAAVLEAWGDVGTRLSRSLLSLGGSYGLYVDTNDVPFDTVLGWVRAATSDNSTALADVNLVSRPHAVGFGWNPETVRCCLFQPSRFGSWIGAVWSDTSPGDFFFPGLALASYEGNVTKAIDRDNPLTESLFVQTMERASGWLIPCGDPPMFLIGLPPTSPQYRELVSMRE